MKLALAGVKFHYSDSEVLLSRSHMAFYIFTRDEHGFKLLSYLAT
jgi:hypothetical protein